MAIRNSGRSGLLPTRAGIGLRSRADRNGIARGHVGSRSSAGDSGLTVPKPGSWAGAEEGFRLSVEFESRASISPNGPVPRRHLRFVYVISMNLISSLSVFPYKVKTRLPSSLVFVTIFWV